jgi:hypothetical protein
VAHYRHQVAVASRLRPQDAKAILGIMERDALDQAGQHFFASGCRLPLHSFLIFNAL